MMRRRSTIALWCYPLKVDREKIIKKKVNGWILLIYQPNIIFLVCSVVKQQISSQKNNIWTLVIQNIGHFFLKKNRNRLRKLKFISPAGEALH